MISIILPVYNVEKYIAKCIESVLNQSYSNFELLIINDGTLDNSIEIAQKYNDKRIKIYNKENGGLSDARNFGLNKATGDFIYFLDSDDWIELNLLEECIKAINKYNTDFVIFGYYLDNEDLKGNLITSSENVTEEILFIKEPNNLVCNEKTLSLLGYAWNKLYKTSFLKENNFIFEKGISLVEDILFNSKVYEKSEKILFINSLLYHYINRPSASLVKVFYKNSFELNILKNKSISSFLEAWNVSDETKNIFLSNVMVTAIRYCVNNLFAYENDLKKSDKLAYIRMMLNNKETQKYISYYNAISFNDKIYKIMIINKAVFPLYLLCKIKKTDAFS